MRKAFGRELGSQFTAAVECLLSRGIPYLQKLATVKASRT